MGWLLGFALLSFLFLGGAIQRLVEKRSGFLSGFFGSELVSRFCVFDSFVARGADGVKSSNAGTLEICFGVAGVVDGSSFSRLTEHAALPESLIHSNPDAFPDATLLVGLIRLESNGSQELVSVGITEAWNIVWQQVVSSVLA